MATNYDWIKVGAQVRIKTEKEIKEMYPYGMPCGLVGDMLQYCGTSQTIQARRVSRVDSYKICVTICYYNWPETVCIPSTTPKGNSL